MKCSKCGYIIGGATIDACFCEEKKEGFFKDFTVDEMVCSQQMTRPSGLEEIRYKITKVKGKFVKWDAVKVTKGFPCNEIFLDEDINLTGIPNDTPIYGADYDKDLKLTFKREPMNERFEIGPVKPIPFKKFNFQSVRSYDASGDIDWYRKAIEKSLVEFYNP
jgi:hypothetical protein